MSHSGCEEGTKREVQGLGGKEVPSGGGKGLRREDLAVSWLPAEELEPRKVWGASLSPGSPTFLKCVW